MKGTFAALVLGLALLTAPALYAAEYEIDTAHSSVGFSIRHIATKVKGSFGVFEGTISFDEKNPSASKIEVTLKVNSINTNNEKRDTHLRSADFFDVDKYPLATFKSKKVTSTGKGKFKVEGDLTLHGVTKAVVLKAEHLGTEQAWGSQIAGFSATTRIKRKDFGFDLGKALETGKLVLSDEVDLTLDIEAKAKK
jgi:polyisoprenoid-binding protein YceI